jgi:hypothetical protein
MARKIYRGFEIECTDGLWEMDRRAFIHLPPKLKGTFGNQDAIERAIDSYYRGKAIGRDSSSGAARQPTPRVCVAQTRANNLA